MLDGAAVHTDPISRIVASTDNSIYQIVPHGVATPRSPGDVATLLAANHSGERRPIVARGGGTGTNGQSLTDGIAVDLKRHLNEIETIDLDQGVAVVQPGVVAAELNRRLARHGLRWAPHTSTITRATVGGMIATDAAGKGSLVHGRTHRHVLAVDLCLADGTIEHLAPGALAAARVRAASGGSAGQLWDALVQLADDIVDRTDPIGPGLARAWTGYGVDRFRRDDEIDPVQLVVGAEGTLGIVTRAWLRLTPLPRTTRLVVAVFDSFDLALEASLELSNSEPSAIETLDEATLDAARASRAWPTLAPIAGDERGAVLLLEYDDPSDDTVASCVDAARATTGCRDARAIDDADRRADVWRVRADAVGLLARRVVRSTGSSGDVRSARPTAFVEDCAVPVERMPRFVAEFRALLDDAGLAYGMFGHADVGCVHVRPALDLTDPDHEQLVSDITRRVTDLVHGHGGLLWGEHGRGLRGGSIAEVLDDNTHRLMRRVKTAFDPDDLCNPGKLYRPLGTGEPILDVSAAPLRGQLDRRVPLEVRAAHQSAFACNGNAACHDLTAAAPMCPSYQATGDPARSPKGRADLIRAWLADRHGPDDRGIADPSFADALATNLHECLSCAACSGRCPVEVDVPELKSRFLAEYHTDRRRPLADHLLGRFESALPVAARVPRLATLGRRPLGRLLGLVDLPAVPSRVRTEHPRFEPGTMHRGEHVVLLADVFTSVLEPDTLDAAVGVLRHAGLGVSVAAAQPSGKYDHVKGRRRRFGRAAAGQRALVESVVRSGARPVVIEPAVRLLHGHEYTAIDARYPTDAVDSLAAALSAAPRTPRSDAPRSVTLLTHCTELARDHDETARWARLLEAAGHRVEVAEVGCCGMAGVFGHERANQVLSRDLWERNWRGPITDAERAGHTVAAPGWSCRSQAARFGGHDVVHPVHLLAAPLPEV